MKDLARTAKNMSFTSRCFAIRPPVLLLALLFALPLALSGCGGGQTIPAPLPQSQPPVISAMPPQPIIIERQPGPALAPVCTLADVPECWQPLAKRLLTDGLEEAYVSSFLVALGPDVPQLAMGTKVNELYNAKYRRTTQPAGTTPRPPSAAVYRGVVTEANAELCRLFMEEHDTSFTRAEQEYGLPRHIGVALLFVETRLGNQVGKHRAACNLAAMAAARSPAHVPDYIDKLPDLDDERLTWLSGRMAEKADWAYGELKALFEYASLLDRDLLEIPGSVYGAIGVCQFMPSNTGPYGKDGDGDGIVDLHNPADAIMSMAHYLSRHGWKAQGMDEQSRRKTLMRYNHSTMYVNTILALAQKIDPTHPATRKSE